jgi:hypothetical protein
MPTGSHAACAACKHPLGAKIDSELRVGATLKSIAEKYGLSIAGVSRHRKTHLSRRFPGPKPAGYAVTSGSSPKQRLENLLQFAIDVIERANRSGSSSVVVNAIRETREITTALAKIEERQGTLRDASKMLEVAFLMMALVPYAHLRHLADYRFGNLGSCGCEECLRVGELTKQDLIRVRDALTELIDDPDRWKAADNFRSGLQSAEDDVTEPSSSESPVEVWSG